VRIWDLPVRVLCRKHLLGEHRELHAIWTILTEDRQGYRHHPEVKRWEGRLQHLAVRHQQQAEEMVRRGWNHKSPLACLPYWDEQVPPPSRITTLADQRRILVAKGCECQVKA